jgi:hypothetical protein
MEQETLKQFLQDKTLLSFEMVGDIPLSVVTTETTRALDVDTSNIIGGTPLENIIDFSIESDVLFIKDVQIDINNINLISNKLI